MSSSNQTLTILVNNTKGRKKLLQDKIDLIKILIMKYFLSCQREII
jgi:hypothetical protein